MLSEMPSMAIEGYRLSPTQRRLWSLQQGVKHSPYHARCAVRIDGPLDPRLLEAALRNVIRRHEILRTTFHCIPGVAFPIQVIADVPSSDSYDVSDFAPRRQTAEVEALFDRLELRSFDLENGPLLHLSLAKHGQDEHILLIRAAAMCSDVQTLGLLVHEISRSYAACAAGDEIADTPLQYADVAEWQNTLLESEDEEAGLAYWRKQTSSPLLHLSLPFEQPPAEAADFTPRSMPVPMAPGLVARIEGLASEQPASIHAFFLACWQVLLSRLTCQASMLTGVACSGRNEELAGAIGLFERYLPLQVELEEDCRFSACLQRVDEAIREVYGWQDYFVWEDSDRSVGGHRQPPFFPFCFAFEKQPGTCSDAAVSFAIDSQYSCIDRYKVKLVCTRRDGGMSAALHYDAALFTGEAIACLAGQLPTLLASAAHRPRATLGQLDMLSETERQQVLVTFNQTQTAYRHDQCLYELFESQVEQTPDAVAVVFEERQLTYRELNNKANQLAHYLRGRGIGPEVLVGFCIERSPEMLVGILGILKSGGAYLPLEPSYPKERLAYMIEDAEVAVLLTQQQLLPSLPSLGIKVVCLDAVGEVLASQSEANPPGKATPANLAYVIYTSGSTGHPKGVLITHDNSVHSTRARLAYYDHPVTCFLLLSSFAFDSSIAGIFWTLCQGGKLCLPCEEIQIIGPQLGELIARERVSDLLGLPSLYGLLLEQTSQHLSSLRAGIVAGEACPRELAAQHHVRLSQAQFFNEYGPTEGTVWSSVYQSRMPNANIPVPIGRPIANVQIYLLDAQLQLVPIGVPGELHIGGMGVARGYLKRADLSAEKFIANPFSAAPGSRLYKTGDLARYRLDGNLEFLGRIDHQVKIRGFRIELGEIEARLRQHPALREVSVLAREDAPGNKRLVAYLVCDPAFPPKVDALRDFIVEQLPDHMLPAAFVFLETLPLTPNGKVDRQALPAPDIGTQLKARYIAPRTPTESVLAAIWAEVLRIERVGVEDNFFELGGDSILSIQVASRANQAGLALTPRQLFQHQNVATLAAAADSGPKAQEERAGGEVPLTPMQHRFFEHALANSHHRHQWLLLKAKQPLDGALLEAAVEHIVAHHDALRLQFFQKDGLWRQAIRAAAPQPTFVRVDLSPLPLEKQGSAIETAASEWQASLDIAEGSLLWVVLFDLGRRQPSRLLIVAHHLVVDRTSWRILLDDLQAACQRLSKSQALVLPVKTTSFKQWSQRFSNYARSDELGRELDHWSASLKASTAPLPVNHTGGENTLGIAHTVTTALGPEETRALLEQALSAYRIQVNDILLAALAQALGRWSGSDSVLVELEGHGREDLFEDIDVSHTIGCFATRFPICLRTESEALGETIKAVKEQLRQIPNHGIGYGLLRYLSEDSQIKDALAALPPAQITFHYLGELDPALDEASPFSLEAESVASDHGPDAEHPRLLEISARVIDHCLSLAWTYCPAKHDKAAIESLACEYMATLRALISHCLSAEAGGCTPSDFPLASLDQAELDDLCRSGSVIEDIYPLSPMQAGMLFHTLMHPGSGIYLMQDRYIVRGDLDLTTMVQAWQQVVYKHPILRTSFVWDSKTKPHQVVHKKVELPFQFLDWRGLPDVEQMDGMNGLLQAELDAGLDFSKAPLIAIRLIRLTENTYHFAISHHHILMDAWCMSLLMVNFFTWYEALTERKDIRPEVARPYRDYIAWLQKQDLAAAETYWRAYLRGFATPTPLVVDRLPQEVPQGEPGVADEFVYLSASDTEALQALAQQHQLTPNTFVQGAWALLMSYYSGQSEVLFGVTVAGRPTELDGVESILGLFINSLPLRVQVDPKAALLAWLKDLLADNVRGRQYEYTPLVQIQGWSELSRGQALFQSLLVFENAPVDPSLSKENLRVSIIDSRSRVHTNYPLTVVIVPSAELQLQLSYDRCLFDAHTVVCALGHFKNLLEGMIRRPNARLCELSLLSEAERQQLLYAWNRTETAYPPAPCFHRLFEAQAHKTPDAVAVVCQGRQLAYAELNRCANRLGHALATQGVGPETTVALLNERNIGLLQMILGVFKAGGAYLPLDVKHPTQRLAQLIALSKTPTVLTAQAFEQQAVDALSLLAEEHRPRVLVLEDLFSQAWPEENLPLRATPSHLAYVIYTSGSTGAPKGVMLTHAGMLNHVTSKVSDLELTTADVIAQTASACFDISVWQLLTALICGARVEIIPDEAAQDPQRLLPACEAAGVTILESVPSLMQGMLDGPPVELTRLRWLLPTGEALAPELTRRWLTRYPRIPLMNAYGPAECSDDVALCPITAPPTRDVAHIPIGHPIANTRLYILDSRLEPCPIGISGELCVGGIGLGRGYLDDAAGSAQAFVPDPFSEISGARLYKTGDRARYQPDGNIEYLGRLDDQVKIRGYRIEPGEIEAQLAQHPQVREAAVMAREDVEGDRRLVAYVVGTEPLAPEVLHAHLKRTLPEYMMPAAFVSLEKLPLNPNGKVDRKALLAPEPGAQQHVQYVAPRTATEEALCAIWKDVLKVEQVGVHDNFFELGGHSLLATQVSSRLRAAFAVALPLRALFESLTVAALAETVDAVCWVKEEAAPAPAGDAYEEVQL